MNNSEREIALRRAESFGRVLFAQADPQHMLQLDYRRSIPLQLLPTAVALADALIESGIETPEDLARFLGSGFPQDTRNYSQALWNAVTTVNVAKSGQPSWDAIYLLLDGENEDESEEELAAKEVAEVKQWAAGFSDELASFESLMFIVSSRPGLGLDERELVKAMRGEMAAIQDGQICEGTRTLSLTLTQGMDDGSSHGTRTLELSVGEGFVKAQCFGTEWQRGQGSDSWSGGSFLFSKGQANERNGDFYNFVGEFEDAIRDEAYVASVSIDDESIGCLPTAEPNDSLGEKLAKAVIRRIVGDLQAMEKTVSGDDSLFENVWDEICAQQRSEESFSGEAYEGTIRVLIAGAVEGMSREERATLWMLTLEGNDWWDDQKSADEIPASCDADLVNSLFGRLKSVASEYLNPRIIRYRDQPRD